MGFLGIGSSSILIRQELGDLAQQSVRPQHEPERDPERLDAVRRCDILDTSAESAFDELTFLASQICNTPMALVAIVDEDRCWFKSKLGLALDEIRNDFILCSQTLLGRDVLTIADARQDHRFRRDLLVSSDPKIRFYAGTPLVTPDGFAVGTLCVMD